MKNLERLEFFKDIDFSNIPEFDVLLYVYIYVLAEM